MKDYTEGMSAAEIRQYEEFDGALRANIGRVLSQGMTAEDAHHVARYMVLQRRDDHRGARPSAVCAGRWEAAMLDVGGRPTERAADAAVIRVARAGHASVGAPYPGAVLPDDVLYEITMFYDEAEVTTRWEQARTVATLLNSTQPGGDR